MEPLIRQRQHVAGVIKSYCLGGQANPTSESRIEQDRLDAEREARIDRLSLTLCGAADPDNRRRIWNELKAEIASRSTAQVKRMERAIGLTP